MGDHPVPGLNLRVIERDGEPWFIATDVCAATKHSNPTVAMRSLEDDEKAKLNLGAQQAVNIVTESGLYTLVLRSRNPDAKAFRQWVTREVLPAIRKNGGYMPPEVAKQAVEDPAVFMAKALAIANETIQRQARRHEFDDMPLDSTPPYLGLQRRGGRG